MRSKHETYRDPAELFASEEGKTVPSVLDQILDNYKKPVMPTGYGHKVHQQEIDETQAVPAGYTLLPAGKERRIGVNQAYIKGNQVKAWSVTTQDSYGEWTVVHYYNEVIMKGEVKTVSGEEEHYVGCSIEKKRTCRISTTGPILVK